MGTVNGYTGIGQDEFIRFIWYSNQNPLHPFYLGTQFPDSAGQVGGEGDQNSKAGQEGGPGQAPAGRRGDFLIDFHMDSFKIHGIGAPTWPGGPEHMGSD